MRSRPADRLHRGPRRRAGRRVEGEDWVRVAAARDAETADRWQLALEKGGIASEVRIEDPTVAGMAGASALTQLRVPGEALFSYSLYAPASDIASARTLLAERMRDLEAREAPARLRVAVWGALASMGVALGLVMLLLLRDGG